MSGISKLQRGSGEARTAIVTGATGRIGQDLSRRLADEGFRVALVGRDGAKLASLAAKLPTVRSGAHVVIAADLLLAGSGIDVARDAIQALGRIGTFFHLACPPVINENTLYDPDHATAMMRVGYHAFMELASVILPHMLPAQHGRIVGFLTEAIKTPVVPTWSSYVASKMALMGALASVAQHCRNTGVSAIGIAPGALDYHDTPLPAGVARDRQLRIDPEYFLDLVLNDIDGSEALDNGSFHLISASGELRGPMTGLASPIVVEQATVTAAPVVAPTAVTAASATLSASNGQKEAAFAALAQTFRRVFNLASDADVGALGTHNLSNWDSLGQLKLLMEVEQALEIRIPTDRVQSITTYKSLQAAVHDLI